MFLDPNAHPAFSWQARRVAFTLKLSGSGPSAEYGTGAKYEDDDSYQFLHDGVLKVTRQSGNVTTYYAAHVWESVQTKDGHAPTPTHRGPASPRA